MKLRFTARARADLLAIGHYIARDKPGAAKRFVKRLQKRARDAAALPRSGRRVPEFGGRDDIREVIERGYRIVYRIVGEEIHLLTVFESHRLLGLGEEDLEV